MKKVNDYKAYLSLVEKYNQKNCHSNDYIQKEAEELIVAQRLYVEEYADNLFFFVDKGIGKRVYYYINNLTELADFSQYKDLVVEILFRCEAPGQLVDYFSHCGFRVNLIRDQYAAMYKDIFTYVTPIHGVMVNMADSLDEVALSCSLFNNSFDHLSGDFISENEYETLLKNKSIIVARAADTHQFLGALHVRMEGKVVVLGHVAVVEDARGKGVGKALVDAFVEWNKDTDKTRYQLWVQRQNKAAVNMYLNKGFKYVNKSTISLIK